MSAFQIRLLAIIAMLIDHIGLFFFPELTFLRLIGRISFPLFAWLIANGAYHTRDINKYLLRLFILACISQLPFILANHEIGSSYWYFNVVFTLSLGLVVIATLKKKCALTTKIWVGAFALLASFIFNVDYGFIGVLSIVAFYLFFNSPKRLVLSQLIIFSFPLIIQFIGNKYWQIFPEIVISDFNKLLGLAAALICVFVYNQREGIKAKYLFYIVYPAQYVIIYLLQLLLNY